VDRHRFDADPEPTFHFDADPDPDPDWHQNNADHIRTQVLHIMENNNRAIFFNYASFHCITFLISAKVF
jgi:hypothetical protein